MMVQPTDHLRRSFIYRQLSAAGAEFVDHANAAVANKFSNEGDATKLGLADLSPLPRTGFKGPEALAWLTEHDIEVPSLNNTAKSQSDNSLVVRLADTEGLVLSDLESKTETVARLETLVPTPGCYPVPRSDTYFWFLLSGVHASDCLLKICGVDVRPKNFPNLTVAQTSIARLGTIAIRDDRGSTLAYHLIADSTSAGYFWDAMLDAMAEFDGRPIGLNSLLALSGRVK